MLRSTRTSTTPAFAFGVRQVTVWLSMNLKSRAMLALNFTRIASAKPLPSTLTIAPRGAKAFVSKEAQPDVVVNTIAMVSRGFICLPEFASRADGFQTLSAREEEVLKKLLAGETNRRIAEELSLNEKTVSYYKCTGLKKLNVQSIAQLAMLEIKPW